MKLNVFRADLNAARALSVSLLGLLGLSIAANLFTLVLLGKSWGTSRTILVPPNIDKTFWVEAERVDPVYLEQMTHYLAMLILNVQPGSIDYQNKILRQYVCPAFASSLDNEGRLNALRVKRDNSTQLFTPVAYKIDVAGRRTMVQGSLATIVNRTPVSTVTKAYVASFDFSSGSVRLCDFRETSADDPFNPEKQAAREPTVKSVLQENPK